MSKLFQFDPVTLTSGATSDFKIDCDALTDEDWVGFAKKARCIVPPFRVAIPVPNGGNRFAAALNAYADKTANMIIFVDDVWTTGKSMMHLINQIAPGMPYHALVLFRRGGIQLEYQYDWKRGPSLPIPTLTALFILDERIR